jgi:adenine-specific DNA-methyltransferase
MFFRQFNGHTQVNAMDMRSLYYPPKELLVALGKRVGSAPVDQASLDALVQSVIFADA